MIFRGCFRLVLVCVGSAAFAVEPANLFPEGAFEMLGGGGVPEEWGLPDANDQPWKAGAVVALQEAEDGNHFARITTVPKNPGFYAMSFVIPVPAGRTSLQVSARMRSNCYVVPGSWSGYKIHVGFAAQEGPGPGIKGYHLVNDQAVLTLNEHHPEWTTLRGQVQIPEGMHYVGLTVLVGSLVGTFDLDDVVITGE